MHCRLTFPCWSKIITALPFSQPCFWFWVGSRGPQPLNYICMYLSMYMYMYILEVPPHNSHRIGLFQGASHGTHRQWTVDPIGLDGTRECQRRTKEMLPMLPEHTRTFSYVCVSAYQKIIYVRKCVSILCWGPLDNLSWARQNICVAMAPFRGLKSGTCMPLANCCGVLAASTMQFSPARKRQLAAYRLFRGSIDQISQQEKFNPLNMEYT